MSIKQKFSDVVLLIKSERRYQVMAGAAVIAVLFLVLHPGAGKPRPSNQARVDRSKEQDRSTKVLSNKEAYTDLMDAFGKKMDELNDSVKKNNESDVERDKRMVEMEERTAEIFKKLLTRIEDEETRRVAQGDAMPGENGGVPSPVVLGDMPDERGSLEQMSATTSNELESFGELTSAEAPPPPPAEPGKVAILGPGDTVRVKLIAGVRAPTDGTPYPCLFKLIGDVTGPDGSSLPLGEARVVAAAQGSLTDSRVLFRLSKLNIRLPDGRAKYLDVDGWVVGEDGIRGMQGIPIDPIGKAIAAGGMVGALGAVGDAFAQAESTTIQNANGDVSQYVTGDVATYALGEGISGFAEQWGDIVSDRVKQMVPHIEVLSGREGTAVFAEPVAIRGLYDALASEEDVFSPMD